MISSENKERPSSDHPNSNSHGAYAVHRKMGNAAATKDFEERELGEAHLDSSSPKAIDSQCVSHDNLRLVQKNRNWYYVSKHTGKEEFVFGIQKQCQFAGSTQVIVDKEGATIAVLQTIRNGQGIKTLVYRTTETFENQQPSVELYKEKEQKKQDLQKFFLFARVQSSAASKCDGNYALLQVHVVYNDPDFAKFQEPPLYRAAKVSGGGIGGGPFASVVMDGSNPETILGKVTSSEAEIANGVDIIATICLGLSVNQSGKSTRGVADSGVV